MIFVYLYLSNKMFVYFFIIDKPNLTTRQNLVPFIYLCFNVMKIFINRSYRVAALPGMWQFRQKKTWKNLEFLTILTCLGVTFDLTQQLYHVNKIFLSSSNFFFIKNYFKVTPHYVFNVFILTNTVSYIKLNFKLKIDPKKRTFNLKTWKTFWKPEKFWKNKWQSCS